MAGSTVAEAANSKSSIPSSARVVIIGGGVIGCSVAYHLGKRGFSDVVLLERHKLTSGTTWHAAGLVVTSGFTTRTGMEIAKYTRDLYATLEQETGSIYVIQGGTHTIQVSGSGFQAGAALNLSADISTDPTQIIDPSQLAAVIRVGATATLGPRTVTVTNPDLASASLDDALFVTRTPDISSDCMVDSWDLNAIARAWNSMSGDPSYVAAADLDGDGLVGPDDLVIFAAYFASQLAACP